MFSLAVKSLYEMTCPLPCVGLKYISPVQFTRRSPNSRRGEIQSRPQRRQQKNKTIKDQDSTIYFPSSTCPGLSIASLSARF